MSELVYEYTLNDAVEMFDREWAPLQIVFDCMAKYHTHSTQELEDQLYQDLGQVIRHVNTVTRVGLSNLIEAIEAKHGHNLPWYDLMRDAGAAV